MPIGKLATPITSRTGILSSPNTSLQQFRSTVRYPWLIEKISRGRDIDAEPDDSGNLVERSQIFFRDGQGIERRYMRCFPASRAVEFLADTPDEFRLLVFDRQHAAEKQ